MSSKVNFCSKCGFSFHSNDEFCRNCGNNRERDLSLEIDKKFYCKGCEEPLQPNDLYCPNCGNRTGFRPIITNYHQVEIKKLEPSVQIAPKDLTIFKTMALIFVISRIIAIVIGFFISSFSPLIQTLISTVINLGGIACLTYGIYLLARKYPKLSSGLKVTYLFVLFIAVFLLQTLFDFLFQATTVNTAELGFSLSKLSNIFIPSLIFSLTIAIITFITAYYFTLWLDIIFSFNKTKTFYFYGLLLLIGSIIVQVGILLFIQSYSTTTVNGVTQPVFNLTFSFAYLIVMVGLLFSIGAYIFEIVAGFKIYNRANDLLKGKIAPRGYQSPYINPNYVPTTPYANQQFNQQNPYQNSNQNPDLNPVTTFDTNFGSNSADNPTITTDKFCKYCGSQIQSESNFCRSCGTRLK